MKKFLFVFLLVNVAGCQDLWAQNIGSRIARDLDKIQAYKGIYHEDGVSSERVTKSIVYKKPWMTRVEVLAPKAHAGELFIYDGNAIKLWWPQAGVGVEIKGLQTPTQKEVRRHIQRITNSNLSAYGFSLRPGTPRVAGEPTKKWRILPLARRKFRIAHTAWMHSRYSMPMRMRFDSVDKNVPWYDMAFSAIDFSAQPGPDAFKFEFPENAIVFRWDLSAPGVSLEQAKKRMNFPLLSPKSLPRGHKISKIVTASHCLPMAAMLANRGGSWLSVTQSRHYPGLYKPLGKPIEVGKERGYLSFLGGFTTVTWVVGKTQLTLTTNLTFPEAIAIAASFE